MMLPTISLFQHSHAILRVEHNFFDLTAICLKVLINDAQSFRELAVEISFHEPTAPGPMLPWIDSFDKILGL